MTADARLLAQFLRDCGMGGCVLCGSSRQLATAGTHPGWCGACRAEMDPTPVDRFLDVFGWTAEEAAELTGVSVRTLQRARIGAPIGRRLAAKLAKAISCDPRVLTHPPEPKS